MDDPKIDGGKPVEVAANHGLESVVVLDPGAGTYRLLTEASYDPTVRLNGGAKVALTHSERVNV